MQTQVFSVLLAGTLLSLGVPVPTQGQRGQPVQLPAGAGQDVVQESCTDCHRLNQAMLTLAQGYVAENEIGTRESLEDVALIRAVADRDATPDWLRRSSIDFIRIIEGYRGPLFQNGNGNGGRMDQVER